METVLTCMAMDSIEVLEDPSADIFIHYVLPMSLGLHCIITCIWIMNNRCILYHQ